MKSPRTFGFTLLASFLWIGCATLKPLSPEIIQFNSPPIGATNERELGETLIDRGTIKTYEAIETTQIFEASIGIGAKLIADPGLFEAHGVTSWGTLYKSATPLRYNNLFGQGLADGGVLIPHSQINRPWLWANLKGNELTGAIRGDFEYSKTTSRHFLPGSFRQELIYNGKSGNTVKFLYRELKDAYLRAPFTQEITYDLQDSTTIGFKGARLEILEASNTKIRYRMLKMFD